MEDRDFFDLLYQGWSKTTGAEDTFWMPEEVEATEHHAHNGQIYEVPKSFDIYSVDQNENRKLVASDLSDEDAAFITAVHGCFADLVRRLHSAVDESDRYCEERDEQECRIAELALENQEQREEIARLKGEVSWRKA